MSYTLKNTEPIHIDGPNGFVSKSLSPRKRNFAGFGPVFAAYLLARILNWLILPIYKAHSFGSFQDLGTKWDGRFLLEIARNGYSFDLASPRVNLLAFFPGQPGIVSAIHAITPFTYFDIAVSLSIISGALAALAVFLISRDVLHQSQQHSQALGILVSTLPMSLVFIMPYTDAPFLALSCWSLYFILVHKEVAGALLCATAGLVRPVGIALAAAIALHLIVQLLKANNNRGRLILAILVAPLGALGYLVTVAIGVSRIDGWFFIQSAGWGAAFDWGASTWKYMRTSLFVAPSVHDVMVSFALPIAVSLLACLLFGPTQRLFAVYSALVLMESYLFGGIINSKLRIIVPAIGLLIPLASVLAKLTKRQMFAICGLAMMVCAWYNAYVISIYPFAI